MRFMKKLMIAAAWMSLLLPSLSVASIDPERLAAFLSSATVHTYAGDNKKAPSTRLQSEDYEYASGNLIYHDTYFGNESFIGEEVVYEDSRPVWGMNYFGSILDPAYTPKEVYGFLIEALIKGAGEKMSADHIPVRGPHEFRKGDWLYTTTLKGKLESFEGEEVIRKGDRMVYRAIFHGGSIRGKEQP